MYIFSTGSLLLEVSFFFGSVDFDPIDFFLFILTQGYFVQLGVELKTGNIGC